MVKRFYLMNMWYNRYNYGAKLTGYALYEILNDLNIDNYMVDLFECFKIGNLFCKNGFTDFDKKYMKSVFNGFDYSNLYKLNNNAEAYIVGSDQIWRYGKDNPFLLDFVNSDKKKIAFSASFGVDKEQFLKENSNETIEKMKNSLKSFDFISVREKSGVEICKDLFDVKAEWIIDPVFILDKSKYDELIDNENKEIYRTTQNDNHTYLNKIVSYVLDTSNDYKKAYKYLGKKYNINVIETANSNISVENWLKSIRDCELFITDSFHGMCFALIFNKPFICLANKSRGKARFDSICEMLCVENQCINSINEVYEKDCVFKVDYKVVNERIKEERQRGLDFLKTALEAPVIKTQEKIDARIQYLESRVKELETENKFSYLLKKSIWNIWKKFFYSLPVFTQEFIRKIRGR